MTDENKTASCKMPLFKLAIRKQNDPCVTNEQHQNENEHKNETENKHEMPGESNPYYTWTEKSISHYVEKTEFAVDLPNYQNQLSSALDDLAKSTFAHDLPNPHTILDIIDTPDLQDLAKHYCQHTGKPCEVESNQTILALVHIHGIERTKTILQYRRKSYAPEWILQDESGLDKLALHDPIGYFVFASSLILQSSFEEKIAAWQALQTQDENVLRVVNEYCRRILGKCQPSKLKAWRVSFGIITLETICQSAKNIASFQVDLQNLLKKLIEYQVTLDDIGIHGFGAFAKQGMSRPLTALEKEIALEFNDFELIPNQGRKPIINLLGKKAMQEVKKIGAQVVKEQKQLDRDMAKFGKTQAIKIQPGTSVKLNLFAKKNQENTQ